MPRYSSDFLEISLLESGLDFARLSEQVFGRTSVRSPNMRSFERILFVLW